MCRKDFTGYICGHCSLPKITPCPITLSNPRFPLCKYIAEVPTWAERYCDPCQRVAFAQDVLLREKIHMQLHIDKQCPCGFDFTEEERQETKARLAEKENGGQVEKSVSGPRRETRQPRTPTQETYPRLNSNQISCQHQGVSPNMGHLDQYLNAPYGQHPLLPIPTHQLFHPYHPQYAFVGVGASPMNQYPGKYNTFPFFSGPSMNTEPVMAFREPFRGIQEIRNAKAPGQNLAEDQPVQDLPAESKVSPISDRNSPYTMEFILSPVDVSSGIVPPSRPHSCPRYEPAVEWDTMSL